MTHANPRPSRSREGSAPTLTARLPRRGLVPLRSSGSGVTTRRAKTCRGSETTRTSSPYPSRRASLRTRSSGSRRVRDGFPPRTRLRMTQAHYPHLPTGKSILPQIAGDAHASQLFRAKLDQRTHELVSALLHDLSDHAIRKSGVVRTTTWLLRLGQGERARETFLSARGRLVRKRARQIKFEGDISMYISELAMVCFTLIKNTCEWYMAAFKDNRMASGTSPSLFPSRRSTSLRTGLTRPSARRLCAVGERAGRDLRRDVQAAGLRRRPGRQGDRGVARGDQGARRSGAPSLIHPSPLEDAPADTCLPSAAQLRDVGLDFTFLLDGLLRPQKPAPQPRVSSSRLRDDALTGSHLRPPKAAAGAGADPSGARAGEPTSAVALARQSIFMMQGGTPSGEEEREVPRVPEGRGSGEEARGAPAGAGAGAGASQQGVGEAQ